MTGAVTGAVALAMVIALTVIGLTTVWFFLAGLPVLVTMLWLCLQFGRLERARFAVLLGVRLPAPPVDLSSVPACGGGCGGWLTERATRRQFGYAVIRCPLGFAEGVRRHPVWSFGWRWSGSRCSAGCCCTSSGMAYPRRSRGSGEMIAGTCSVCSCCPSPHS